jgi:hypothetical protein
MLVQGGVGPEALLIKIDIAVECIRYFQGLVPVSNPMQQRVETDFGISLISATAV